MLSQVSFRRPADAHPRAYGSPTPWHWHKRKGTWIMFCDSQIYGDEKSPEPGDIITITRRDQSQPPHPVPFYLGSH